MEVGEEHEIELRGADSVQLKAEIAGNPFAGSMAGVGHGGGHGSFRAMRFACVDECRSSVGTDDKGGIAAPGVDVMDLENSRLPGRERGLGASIGGGWKR
jgi:hypothetical protein